MMLKQEVMGICYCNFCHSAIRFMTSRAGETVNCPHCLMETVLRSPETAPEYPAEKFILEARGISWKTNSLGYRELVGEVANKSASDLDWVRIEFTLYNSRGEPVGSTSDCLINFPAGHVWTFQAPVFQKDASAASAPVVSCEYGVAAQRFALSSSPKAGQPAGA